MAKNSVPEWDATAANNTDVGGISIAENMQRANVNNAMREIMAQVKEAVASQGSDIASASTTDIGAATGQYVKVTGTTTITALGTVAAGTMRWVEFTGALTLTHNGTSLKLPTSANITTAAGDTACFVSLGSGNWKCLEYMRLDGSPVAVGTAQSIASASAGTIVGLTLSNGTDATNDIDIATGLAMAADRSACLTLGSALTKQLDAAWAVGTNQGGLDTGSIANTTYHVWLIRRPDTGVVDALFSTSASSPTMPANYTQKRRIGSIIRSGGSIVGFKQIGDRFLRTSQATDRSDTAAAASALLTLSVPVGIVVFPIMQVSMTAGASVTCTVDLGSAEVGSANTGVARIFSGAGDSNDAVYGNPAPVFATNTSAQIYFAQTNTAGTPSGSTLATLGWIDRRGRDE